MISRFLSAFLLVGLATTTAPGQQPEERSTTETATSRDTKANEEKPAVEFSWIRSDSPLQGQKFEKHELTRLPRYVEYGPWADTEAEMVQVNETTTRRTVRVYRKDPQGRRRLEEVVEEEQQTGEDGSVHAVRTVSATDANGKLRINRRESQETVPTGENAFRTETKLETLGVSRKLEVVERIEQTERRNSDDTIQIERSRYMPDPNGNWQVTERREASTSESNGIVETDEKVYRLDGLRNLTLSEQQASTEWVHDDGTLYRTIETSRPNLRGRLEPVQKVDLIRQELAEGGQQMIEQVSTRPLGAQTNELKLVERVIRHTEGKDGREQTTWIEGLDMNGELTGVTSFTTVTSEESSGKKTTRTVSN